MWAVGQSGLLPLLVNEVFNWGTATPTCLRIVYGYFLTEVAELSRWERDHMAGKGPNIYYLILYGK